MDELKPCPFCGGVVTFTKDSRVGGVVGCDTESCMGREGPFFSSYERAVFAWNTRSPDPAVVELVRAARQITGTKASGYQEPLVYELPFQRLASALAPFQHIRDAE